MSAPVSKKFMQEFEEKQQQKKCFGFLKGRKVKKKEIETNDYLVRSPGLLDIRKSTLVLRDKKCL